MSGKDSTSRRWEILVEQDKVNEIESLVWEIDRGIVIYTFRGTDCQRGLTGLLFCPSDECKLLIILKFSPVDITFGTEINL